MRLSFSFSYIVYACMATLGLVAIAGLVMWRSSVPPDPKVYEGKVAQRVFVPEHIHHFMRQQYAGQSCTNVKTGSSSYTSCNPVYIWVPDQEVIPDAWFLKVKGCPRRQKDPVQTFCDKPKIRTVRVGEVQYTDTQVGAEWKETA